MNSVFSAASATRFAGKWLLALVLFVTTSQTILAKPLSPFWQNATVYFLMTDRFNNGDTRNDKSYGRTEEAARLRGFEGGDIQGIIQKLREGYFNDLGVDAIWTTPVIEQVHGYDESAGKTYSYHGYWPKDWTAVDANFGSEEDFATLVREAHAKGIRIIVDVIINHTGPETEVDHAWPNDWIRTRPICNWTSFEQNTRCALATSLTDIKTESEAPVALPPWLLDKWRSEGRLDKELQELEMFFARTGYPKAPKYYIVKWLTDWVRDYGVDGFRVDTAKHVEADIWTVLKQEANLAFADWKRKYPSETLDDENFYMVGEVFNWGLNGFKNADLISGAYDYGDKKVNFFDYGFDALINMGFIAHVGDDAETLFASYAKALQTKPLADVGVLNYIGSHDDMDSFDKARKLTFDTAFKLMMAPGGVQIYYGDEIARPMQAEDAFGDAGLRVPMNWEDLPTPDTQALLSHWQKLGQFRQRFPVIGAGSHTQLQHAPYVFTRELSGFPTVIVSQGLAKGHKTLHVGDVFKDGQSVKDYYSGQIIKVTDQSLRWDSPFTYALIGPVTTD